MKTIIAGSREGPTYTDIVVATYGLEWKITEVVCGMAPGADLLGKLWAEKHGIPVKCFPADWSRYGKRAGPIRNVQMAEYADALIAIWDGKSNGTAHMIREARSRGMLVCIFRIDGGENGYQEGLV